MATLASLEACGDDAGDDGVAEVVAVDLPGIATEAFDARVRGAIPPGRLQSGGDGVGAEANASRRDFPHVEAYEPALIEATGPG